MKNVYCITVKCRYTERWMRRSSFEATYNVLATTAFQALKRVPGRVRKDAEVNGYRTKVLDIVSCKLIAENTQ